MLEIPSKANTLASFLLDSSYFLQTMSLQILTQILKYCKRSNILQLYSSQARSMGLLFRDLISFDGYNIVYAVFRFIKR